MGWERAEVGVVGAGKEPNVWIRRLILSVVRNKGKLGDHSAGNNIRNLESSVKGLIILNMNFGVTSH